MKCDAQTAERIGFNWLRVAIAPVGDFGRRTQDATRPFGPRDAAPAIARCAQVIALAQQLDVDAVAHVRGALRRAPDPIDIVSRANVGETLTDVDFFELGRFCDALDATSRAWTAAGGSAPDQPPAVPQIADLLEPGRQAGSFYLADSFAEPLAAARAEYAGADAALVREHERLGEALASLIGNAPAGEEFIVMRDVMANVPAGTRVVRETPVYRLLALELDTVALAAAARREQASVLVAQQEEFVRRELTAGVALHGPALLTAAEALGELDCTLARVVFTQQWGGCVPLVTDGRFDFTAASFVPLRAALSAAGLPYTAISIDLPGVAILTGPNMGGKSAALATCGFLAACIASGVPPPATAAALPLLDSVAWIGGQPDADRAPLLSAFAGEVVRTRDLLAAAGHPALILVDEFARTTGPREGRALLVALVESLARRGVFALIATHFDGVARAAAVPHFAIAGLGNRHFAATPARDARAALDAVAQAMDYRIIAADGEAHSASDALALAGLLGLDADIVARATVLFSAAATGPLARLTE